MIVCLSGPVRYEDAYKQAMVEEIQRGNVVLYTPVLPELTQTEAKEHHYKLIDLCDALRIVGDHIGNATSEEIDYAQSLGKAVIYTSYT